MKKIINFIFLIFIIFTFYYCDSNSNDELSNEAGLEDIKLPPRFRISIFANNIENARSLCLSPNGILFVGTRTDKVYAIVDTNKDYKADKTFIIASGLNSPNGVAFRNGSLFVAEINRVLRYDNIENNLENPPKPIVVNDNFPSDEHHGWKFIAFGPDDKLYVPVGAPCNVCLMQDERYASIMRMNPDGSQLELFASGIRNTVGFDWYPITNELWFTDNGRDWLGDNQPPDELNRAYTQGLHFGFPFLHGNNILDPEFGQNVDTSNFTKPAWELGPHVAALGMRFYTGNMFPSEYKNQIFICEHGSWNRSEKIGYRISLVKLEGNRVISYEPFVEGFLKNGNVSGRPVDVEIMPDGSLLVSDDFVDKIYRITYQQ